MNIPQRTPTNPNKKLAEHLKKFCDTYNVGMLVELYEDDVERGFLMIKEKHINNKNTVITSYKGETVNKLVL